jgi:hypothetical protein
VVVGIRSSRPFLNYDWRVESLGGQRGNVTSTSVSEIFIHEHDGQLWKPLPGASSQFDELLYAQTRWLEIVTETDWNPWRKDELEPEQRQAEDVMREWTRAEPDFRPMTKRQVAAMVTSISRNAKAEYAANEARWERDKAQYEPERERARWSLLEREAVLAQRSRELEQFRSGERFPGMVPDKREHEMAELATTIERESAQISRLKKIVGDPDDVVDEQGKLPRDRRGWNLTMYGLRRRTKVTELRDGVGNLENEIVQAPREERSKLRTRLHFEHRQLEVLLAVPPLEAAEMCADCLTPQFQHGFGDVFETRPCPVWPDYAERMKRVWDLLRTAEPKQTESQAQPKAEPLATLKGGLPIADVIERLSELKATYPDAVVKRGRANLWEIWQVES